MKLAEKIMSRSELVSATAMVDTDLQQIVRKPFVGSVRLLMVVMKMQQKLCARWAHVNN